mgnify:CR=1 FL=1
MESTRQAVQKHGRATKRPAHSGKSGGNGADVSDLDPRVDHLRRRFAQFRATHPLRTRIPSRLRTAALAAVQDGATESDVRRACGVTSDQLAQWRAGHAVSASRSGADAVPSARVFPVTATEADVGATDHGPAPGTVSVELRVGGLSIVVRALQV